jgi:hypothetical protein
VGATGATRSPAGAQALQASSSINGTLGVKLRSDHRSTPSHRRRVLLLCRRGRRCSLFARLLLQLAQAGFHRGLAHLGRIDPCAQRRRIARLPCTRNSVSPAARPALGLLATIWSTRVMPAAFASRSITRL